MLDTEPQSSSSPPPPITQSQTNDQQKKNNRKKNNKKSTEIDENMSEFVEPKTVSSSPPARSTKIIPFFLLIKIPIHMNTQQSGRQRFREIRQNMQNDEDENVGNTLTPDSQNSSVEGVYYAAQRTTHPFRIIEHDTASIQSMTSLGRVGRILAGSIDPSMSVGRDSIVLSKSSSTQQMSGSSITSKSGDSETQNFTVKSIKSISPERTKSSSEKIILQGLSFVVYRHSSRFF